MRLESFNYELPPERIAQKPARPRDAAKLLVVDRRKAAWAHRRFFDITDYISRGDVLVLNDSKVIPARLHGRKSSGGAVEIFLSRRIADAASSEEVWECLTKGKRLVPGTQIILPDGHTATLKSRRDQTWLVSFDCSKKQFERFLNRHGSMPLPPYISPDENDTKNYQTVYADAGHAGSVAAPTAGLHFTPRLLKKLKDKGVIIKKITLHVGLGTFMPVRVNDPKKHTMHAEWVEVGADVLSAIKKARQKKRKVIAVGTTTVRSLEAAVKKSSTKDFSGWVDIFIYPPFRFKAVDAMITNFHLPKSTLLMLVSAFAGRKKILDAYETAIKENYRFYSYGDAMLIV